MRASVRESGWCLRPSSSCISLPASRWPRRRLRAFFADREGLSSATMRNVMATLGEAGLLEQPHTSAGRVPTAAAFRYYVEQITQPGRMAAGAAGCLRGASAAASPLSEARRGQIEESFTGVTSSNEYLERTSHVLALHLQRPGRGAGQLHRGPGAGAHSFFAAFDGPCAGRAGDPGRRGAGSRAGAGPRTDPRGAGDRRALPERELSRLAHRAHPRRGGAARGGGARSLSPDAGLGGGALPQGRAGRRRGRPGASLWTAWPT